LDRDHHGRDPRACRHPVSHASSEYDLIAGRNAAAVMSCL
jgi:hypothetical protein